MVGVCAFLFQNVAGLSEARLFSQHQRRHAPCKYLCWQKKISTLGPPQLLHHCLLLAAASGLHGAPSVSVPRPILGQLKCFSKDLGLEMLQSTSVVLDKEGQSSKELRQHT